MSRCDACLSVATFTCPDCNRSACPLHWQELEGHVDYVMYQLPDEDGASVPVAVPSRCYAGLDIDTLARNWMPDHSAERQLLVALL